MKVIEDATIFSPVIGRRLWANWGGVVQNSSAGSLITALPAKIAAQFEAGASITQWYSSILQRSSYPISTNAPSPDILPWQHSHICVLKLPRRGLT